MVVDDLFFVVHAAVTDLYGVTVEDFSKFVAFSEVFVYWSKKFLSDVSADVFAEWTFVPEDVVCLSVFSFGCLCRFVG